MGGPINLDPSPRTVVLAQSLTRRPAPPLPRPTTAPQQQQPWEGRGRVEGGAGVAHGGHPFHTTSPPHSRSRRREGDGEAQGGCPGRHNSCSRGMCSRCSSIGADGRAGGEICWCATGGVELTTDGGALTTGDEEVATGGGDVATSGGELATGGLQLTTSDWERTDGRGGVKYGQNVGSPSVATSRTKGRNSSATGSRDGDCGEANGSRHCADRRHLHSWHAAGSGGVLKARSKMVANRWYTMGAGDSCASLVVVQFQRQPPLVGELNRGWMCRSQSLFAGMPLCIAS
ncbi:unnamed protein product [Closterium sp. Naga37s-1]|nr:unnamed protein product [Closterium sp. Naga37s-1]